MPDLSQLWEQHTAHEFSTRDTEATLETMGDDAYVNHIPVLTGGYGKTALRRFYPSARRDSPRGNRSLPRWQVSPLHIYWDQASVLKQIGLLNDPALPVRGVETAHQVLRKG